jgi:hypothetical protein
MRVKTITHWALGLVLSCAVGGLYGCASGGDDDENGAQANDNSDLGNDDAHDGNHQEDYTDNDDKGGNKDSADVNSSTESLDAQLDKPANNATPPPANNAAPPANATAAATPPPAAQKAPADGGPQAPVQGGRVRYVKQGGVQAVSAPNGQPVMTIEQGEHPVTWEENGFLKIANGLYVPVDSLSEKGVPRPQDQKHWNAH